LGEHAALRAREAAVEVFGLAARWGAGPPAPCPQIACALYVSLEEKSDQGSLPSLRG